MDEQGKSRQQYFDDLAERFSKMTPDEKTQFLKAEPPFPISASLTQPIAPKSARIPAPSEPPAYTDHGAYASSVGGWRYFNFFNVTARRWATVDDILGIKCNPPTHIFDAGWPTCLCGAIAQEDNNEQSND